MPGGFDVVLHVADEDGLVGSELVLFENLVNLFAFVPDADVRAVQVFIETGNGALDGEVVLVDRTQQECAQALGAAEFEEFARVGQFANGILHLPKAAVEPGLKLGQWNVGKVPIVKAGEWKAEFGAEFRQAHLRPIGLRQDVVGGLPDGGQIVHQSAGPIENHVANHADIVTTVPKAAT